MTRTSFRTRGRGKNRKVYPVTSSSGKHKRNMTTASVIQVQQKRSPHAIKIDNAVKAKTVTKEEWVKDPSRGDLKGVDTPKTKTPKKQQQTQSEAMIDQWKGYKENYESGKWRGGEEVYKDRLRRYQASLILGREFQEKPDDYLERKGYTKFYNWASKETTKKQQPQPVKKQEVDFDEMFAATAKPKPKAKKSEKIKIRKRKVNENMRGLEKKHLKDFCNKHGLDPQEIDYSLTYSENKKHLHTVARQKGISQREITSEKEHMNQWNEQYYRYLEDMKGQLEEAGYTVESPSYMPSM